jgi:hypothetical protein
VIGSKFHVNWSFDSVFFYCYKACINFSLELLAMNMGFFAFFFCWKTNKILMDKFFCGTLSTEHGILFKLCSFLCNLNDSVISTLAQKL